MESGYVKNTALAEADKIFSDRPIVFCSQSMYLPYIQPHYQVVHVLLDQDAKLASYTIYYVCVTQMCYYNYGLL